MKIEGAIFDLDGTLIDSMHIWDDIDERYLVSKGKKPGKDIKDKLKTMSLMQAAEFFRENFNITDLPEKIIEDITGMVAQFYKSEVRTKPGAYEFLQLLSSKGVRMCIATATDIRLAVAALRRNNIEHFFEKIFTCGEVGCGKDFPEIYNRALEFLGTDINKTLVFEDAAHAAQTAHCAGFKVCAVFDKSENDTDTLKQNSYICIKSFEEAVSYID